MKNYKKHVSIHVVLVFAILVYGGTFAYGAKESIHIAFVMGEIDSTNRSSLLGAKLYIDMINRQGGLDGKKIVLDVFDDQNSEEKAREKALEIVKQDRAVAVIGHAWSSCSISGGEVYKENKIPAISPVSTNINVTKNNAWYFRTVFDDNLQGRFLANYTKMVLKQNQIHIIHEDLPYGAYLAEVLETTANDLGLEVRSKLAFDTKEKELNNIYKKIQ